MSSDPEIIRSVRALFGDSAYSADGTLQKKVIADAIFNDARLRIRLEHIVHPAVMKKEDDWFRGLKGAPYGIVEAALIFESGNDRSLDFIIVVDAGEVSRITRTMARSGSSEADVRKRMDAQWPAGKKKELADFVIMNDGTMEELRQKVFFVNTVLQSYARRGRESLQWEEGTEEE